MSGAESEHVAKMGFDKVFGMSSTQDEVRCMWRLGTACARPRPRQRLASNGHLDMLCADFRRRWRDKLDGAQTGGPHTPLARYRRRHRRRPRHRRRRRRRHHGSRAPCLDSQGYNSTIMAYGQVRGTTVEPRRPAHAPLTRPAHLSPPSPRRRAPARHSRWTATARPRAWYRASSRAPSSSSAATPTSSRSRSTCRSSSCTTSSCRHAARGTRHAARGTRHAARGTRVACIVWACSLQHIG